MNVNGVQIISFEGKLAYNANSLVSVEKYDDDITKEHGIKFSFLNHDDMFIDLGSRARRANAYSFVIDKLISGESIFDKDIKEMLDSYQEENESVMDSEEDFEYEGFDLEMEM